MLPDLKFRITAQGAYTAAFADARREIDRTKSSLAGLRVAGIGFLGGLGAGVAMNALNSLPAAISAAVAEMDELSDASMRAGASAEDLQVLRYALDKTAGDAAQADAALAKFGVVLGQAAGSATSGAAQAFARLGVEIRDVAGRLRDSQAVFGDVADRLAAVESPARRASLAAGLFGEELGPVMATALAQGRAGLAAYRDSLEDLGILMSDEMVARGAAFQDKFEEVSRFLDTTFKIAVVEAADMLWYMHDTFVALENRTNLASLRGELDQVTSELQKEAAIVQQLKESGTFDGLLFSTKSTDELIAEHQAKLTQLTDLANQINERMLQIQDPTARPGLQHTPIDPSLSTDPAKGTTSIKRTTTAVRELRDEFALTRDLTRDWLTTFTDGLMNGTSLLDSMADAAKSLASRLVQMGINGIAGAIFPTPGAAAGLYHSGGLVGAPSSSRTVNPAVFAGAPRMHGGGIAGLAPDEVPAILQRGERVLPRGASDGGIMDVRVTVDASPDLMVRVSKTIDGKIGANNRSLPDRMAASARNPRRRGQ